MRFLRGIFNGRHAVRHACGKHDIDCCAHACLVQINRRTFQMLRTRFDYTVFFRHHGAQRAETFQMQIYRAFAEIAAARHCHFRLFIPRQQSPQQIIGGSQLLYLLEIRLISNTLATVDFHGMLIQICAFPAYFFNRCAEVPHVLNTRKVFQYADPAGHHSRRNHRYRRVFRPADGNLASQPVPALHNQFIHKMSILPVTS